MIRTLQLGQFGRTIRGAVVNNDPFYANVILHCHFDGTNGGTVFTDQKGKTATTTGNCHTSVVEAKFGVSSLRVDGAGDFLDWSHSDFNLGTGDFTVEYWMMLNAAQDYVVVDTRFGGVTGSYVVYDSVGGGATTNATFFANGANRASSGNLSTAQWYHVALSRVTGVSRFFIDGVQQGSAYTDSNNYSSTQFRFGHNNTATSASTGGFNGWLDELRVTKGVGRYSANFTPPTAAFPNS